MIYVFLERKWNEKECFLLYYCIQQHMIDMILVLFCIFLDDETILLLIQSSDSASNPTISIPHPSIRAPIPTPVATYFAPDSMPNDIFLKE